MIFKKIYPLVYLLIFSVPIYSQTLSNPSACGLGLPITDNNCPENGVFFSPDQFFIDVNNAPGFILGVDVFLREVRLTIQHEWASDLDVVLASPGGARVTLTSDNGGGDDNYGDPLDPLCTTYTTFTLNSCTPIESGNAPFLETDYRPEDSFFTFNDSLTNPNGFWTLFICDDFEDDIGSLEFVELVFEPITCLPITDVEILNIDSTTVELSWWPTTDCGMTVIEYGPPGFTPGSTEFPGQGAAVIANCPPFLLQGLMADTEYEIYLRKECSNGLFSENSCPTYLVTGCLPVPATIVEDFNDQDQCSVLCGSVCDLTGVWWNGMDDDFDWQANMGPTDTQGTGPSDDISEGGKYVYIETSGISCAPGGQAYLYSNCIELDRQGSDTCHMSFNYHMFGNNVGRLQLEVSSTGGFTWVPLWQQAGNQGDEWKTIGQSFRRLLVRAVLLLCRK